MWLDSLLHFLTTTSKHIIRDLQLWGNQETNLNICLNIRWRFICLRSELQQHCEETAAHSKTEPEHISSSFRNNESFIYNFKDHLVNKYILCTYLQSKQCLFYNNRSGYSNSGSGWIDSIFTPIKELYKSSSALSAHSQHIIINIHKHFKRWKGKSSLTGLIW